MSDRSSAVGRNYAQALLTLAQKAEDASGWGTMLRQLASAIEGDTRLYRFLESPRVPATVKSDLLGRALGDRVPRLFLRWVQALVRNRRQMMIPNIADEYDTLFDAAENRVHARITFASQPTEQETNDIAARLSAALRKDVVPHVITDPEIIGGIVVRVGDTIMDGSVRKRLASLRRQMANSSSW